MKKIIIILSTLIAVFIFSAPAQAADLTVTCSNQGPCTIAPANTALFEEMNWYPGSSVTRNINVTNNDPDDTCNLYLDTFNETDPDGLAGVIFTVIQDGSNDLFGKRAGPNLAAADKDLKDVFTSGQIYLTNLLPNTTKNIPWVITLDGETVGNEFQGKKTIFDFEINFSCGQPPSSPTPTPSSTPGSPAPGSPAPGSPDPGSPAPGSPAPSSTGITTGSLNSSVSIINNINTSNIAGQIAGVTDTASPYPSTTSQITAKKGQVKGLTCEKQYPWWIPLVIQLVLSIIYYWWSKDKKIIAWWTLPLVLAGVSQLIHQILGCLCSNSKWCQYYWVFNLIILITTTGYYLLRKKNHSKKLT